MRRVEAVEGEKGRKASEEGVFKGAVRWERGQRGVGAVEALLLVCLLVVLLSAVIPLTRYYSRLSKESEAVTNLAQIHRGAQDYFVRSIRVGDGQKNKKRHFPSTEKSVQREGRFAVMPALAPCQAGVAQYPSNPGAWDTPTEPWSALSFSIRGAHFYRYGFASEQECEKSPTFKGAPCYYVQAQADLDCNTRRSVISMHGGFSMLQGDIIRLPLVVHQRGE
jgi:type II secretory pathway pseudopilin PulG